MSANREYYKYFLTESGWIRGESKEWQFPVEINPVDGHVFAILTYTSDGDCGCLCAPELELEIVDNTCLAKVLELIESKDLPDVVNENDFRRELKRVLS